MKLHDSCKMYTDGAIGKVLSPDQTVAHVIEKINRMKYPILDHYQTVKRPSGIPQYIFAFNENFRRFRSNVYNTNGKGHTHDQAMASGIMEMVERYSCHKYISFRNKNIARITCFDELESNPFTIDSLLSMVTIEHPDTELLGEIRHAEMAFYHGCTLEGQNTYLPLNLLLYLFSTTGMAAGNSFEEALLHAVCEVIERHCLANIRLEKLKTPTIDPDSVTNPIAADLLNRLKCDNQRIVIKDFSLGLGIPVVGVVRTVDAENCLVTAGVATHYNEAMIRALTESSQADNKIYYEDISSSKHYFSETESISLERIDCIDNRNIKTELEKIGDLLALHNMTVIYVDTTDEELNVPSVMAYVTNSKNENSSGFSPDIIYSCALIEGSFFLEKTEAAYRYITLGKKYDQHSRAFSFFEGLYHALRNRFEVAVKCFDRLLNTPGLDDILKHRILVLTALCHHMSGNEHSTALSIQNLKNWDKRAPFIWNESIYTIFSIHVKTLRRYILSLFLAQIYRYYVSGNHVKMIEKTNELLKLNSNCGLLFNHDFLTALVFLNMEDYNNAWLFLMKAKTIYPCEPFYDELVRKTQKHLNANAGFQY